MKAVNLIPAEQRGGASVGVGRSQGAAGRLLSRDLDRTHVGSRVASNSRAAE